MEEVLTFGTVAKAMARGRSAEKANFFLEGNPDKDEKNYTCTFKSNWNGKRHDLSSQLANFLAASYRAEALTAQELKVDPSLSVTQDVVHTLRQINMNLHPKFVHEMTGNSEKLFSNPEIEAELSGPVRKKQHNTQLSTFNRLQNDAVRKLHELEEFVGMQVDV